MQAEYWQDPLNETEYRKYSVFLADINQENVLYCSSRCCTGIASLGFLSYVLGKKCDLQGESDEVEELCDGEVPAGHDGSTEGK